MSRASTRGRRGEAPRGPRPIILKDRPGWRNRQTGLPAGRLCLPAGRRSDQAMFTIYALQSDKDGGLYIGMTERLERRLRQHNAGQTTSTKARAPFRVIYTEVAETRVEARQREKFLKSGVGREFLKAQPGWR